MNILIVGGGKVGANLTSVLSTQGHQVTIIEMNSTVFTKLQRMLPQATIVLGDGCNPLLLREAAIETMDAAVAVTGDDEDNLVVAKLAKHEYSVAKVVARVNNLKNEWLFTPRMGVDIAVSHATMLARVIHEELSMGDLVPLLKLNGGQISLAEVTVTPLSHAIGSRVDQLKLPEECVLATLLRNGQILIPRGQLQLQAGDKIIALVRTEQQAELVRIFG